MQCITPGCKKERKVFADGKGRSASRCDEHLRQVKAAREGVRCC